MRSKRVLSAVAVAAIAGLVVTACGSGDGGSGGNDGTLRLGLGEPKSLIPPNVGETEGGEITQLVYSGLYTYDVDGSLKPVIADGAPTTEDNKVWTIKVKPGFTFQNGEAINAETFVKTWNYATYGPNGNKGSYFFDKVAGYADVQSGADPDGEEGPKKGADPKAKELSGVKALDENTLEITLDKPWIGFSTMLGYTAFYPMADACLAAVDACNETPIGNGMYQFDGKWEHSTAIKLKKWADYKGEQPTIEKINFKIYTGDATAYPDFRAGTIDIAAPTADKYAEAKSQYPDMIEVASNSHWSVGFPVYDDVFKDPKVRKAFSMAIDRQAFVDGVFQGRYTPANSWTPSIIPGFLDNTCGTSCTFDPEAAKALLAESSWPEGKKLDLWVNTGPGEKYLKVLGDQFNKNLGISYELNTLEWPVFLEKKESKELTGPFLTGWVADYPLNQNYLEPLYGHGPDNDFGYHGEAFEALLAEGDSQATLEEAIVKYQEAEKALAEDLPVAPLWTARTATLLGDRIDKDSYVINPILGGFDYAKLKLK